MTNAALQTDMRKWLGADTCITVQYSDVASGLGMSAGGYAVLLRKIMGNRLVISNLMGSNKTCTLPQTCPQSSFSPLEPRDWDYSIGHWVEREPGGSALRPIIPARQQPVRADMIAVHQAIQAARTRADLSSQCQHLCLHLYCPLIITAATSLRWSNSSSIIITICSATPSCR